MQNRHKRRLQIGAGIVITMGLVLPIIFGAHRGPDGKGGDPWRNTIFDFQTLIAGVMAIGAAYGTIQQMRKSDARSDERHEQLIRLSRRAEALRIERLLYPAFGYLRECYKGFRDCKFDENPFHDDRELRQAFFDDVESKLPWLRMGAQQARDLLQPFTQEEAKVLFDGYFTSNINRLIFALDYLLSQIETLDWLSAEFAKLGLDSRMHQSHVATPIERKLLQQLLQMRDRQEENWTEVPSSIRQIVSAFDPVFAGFWKLIDLYGLDIEIG